MNNKQARALWNAMFWGREVGSDKDGDTICETPPTGNVLRYLDYKPIYAFLSDETTKPDRRRIAEFLRSWADAMEGDGGREGVEP